MPETATGRRVEFEVQPETRLEDAITESIRRARAARTDRAFYWAHFLKDASDPNPEYVGMPRLVLDENGEAIWTEGAKDRVTFADLVRARDAGYFDGDPFGVWLEAPTGGNGVIPDLLDLFDWLEGLGVAGLLAVLKGGYERGDAEAHVRRTRSSMWSSFERNGTSRNSDNFSGWNDERHGDLLDSFGYEPVEGEADTYRVSSDPNRTEIRRRILKEQLHRDPDDLDKPYYGEPEDDGDE